jgi:hypothetical protein
MAFDSALSASIAPSAAKAGLVMRAVVSMALGSCHIGRLTSVTPLTGRIARM